MSKVRRVVTLVNEKGLHARPVSRLLEVARRHQARLTVRSGEQQVDGRSMLQLLTLAAPGGSELELEADGDDAEELLAALAALIAGRFGEE